MSVALTVAAWAVLIGTIWHCLCGVLDYFRFKFQPNKYALALTLVRACFLLGASITVLDIGPMWLQSHLLYFGGTAAIGLLIGSPWKRGAVTTEGPVAASDMLGWLHAQMWSHFAAMPLVFFGWVYLGDFGLAEGFTNLLGAIAGFMTLWFWEREVDRYVARAAPPTKPVAKPSPSQTGSKKRRSPPDRRRAHGVGMRSHKRLRLAGVSR